MKTLLLISAFGLSAFQHLPADPPRPFGAGTITRGSDGFTAITTRFGNGTRTVITSPGKPSQSLTTTRFGNGSLTRMSDGRTAVTSRFGWRRTDTGGRKDQARLIFLPTSALRHQTSAIRSSIQSDKSRSITGARTASQASRAATSMSPSPPASTRLSTQRSKRSVIRE